MINGQNIEQTDEWTKYQTENVEREKSEWKKRQQKKMVAKE